MKRYRQAWISITRVTLLIFPLSLKQLTWSFKNTNHFSLKSSGGFSAFMVKSKLIIIMPLLPLHTHLIHHHCPPATLAMLLLLKQVKHSSLKTEHLCLPSLHPTTHITLCSLLRMVYFLHNTFYYLKMSCLFVYLYIACWGRDEGNASHRSGFCKHFYKDTDRKYIVFYRP